MSAAPALVSVLPAALAMRQAFRRRGVDFWVTMTAVTAGLGSLALWLRGLGPWAWRLSPTGGALGVAAAAALYALFYVGDRALLALLPAIPAAGGDVYALADGGARLPLTAALLLLIGPGEELFWRGLVQWNLQHLLPAWAAVAGAALLYAGAHLTTRNPALVLAALLGGIFWGGLYVWSGNLPAVIMSHGLWDCLALLWLPLPVAARSRT